MKLPGTYHKKKTAGTTQRKVELQLRASGQFCSFADVGRACHNWLMKNDPVYRRMKENPDNKQFSY